VIAELIGWGHLRVTGGDTVRFLQGICTINIEALAPGGHGWGAMLNPKGRVLSVIQATRGAPREPAGRAGSEARLQEPRGPDEIVVHCEPSLTDKTLALLEKYAVMDDVAFERLEGAAYMIWPEPGDPAGAAGAWDAPVVMGALPGAPASAEAVEIVRVEAGMLRYGVDVDEDHFPFETPLGRFLDYGKGCYVGQEPVFRVHSQGGAARFLRGLVIDGAGAVAPGAPVAHAERENAGKVTSSAVSPRHGAIALAYLHRTVAAPGGEVTVEGRRAVVREVPLVP
jgi:folate-binding protein YgfZ